MIEMEYYSAAWCGPCKAMGPVIDQLKGEGWNITKIDVDKDPGKAKSSGVQAMPTFIIYRDGLAIRRIVGARQKYALESELRLARDVLAE